MNWITESSKKFQPLYHFTQSHIPFKTNFLWFELEAFVPSSQNTLRQEKFTIQLGISSA